MSLDWEQMSIEALEPSKLGLWWAGALNWIVIDDNPEAFKIRSRADESPGLLFTSSPQSKNAKLRWHLDLRPDDQAAEVSRLLDLGATLAAVGQSSAVPWVVLSDLKKTSSAFSVCLLPGSEEHRSQWSTE